jgi:hypothetical protein
VAQAAPGEIVEHLEVVLITPPPGRGTRDRDPGPDLEHPALGIVELVPDATDAGGDVVAVTARTHEFPFRVVFHRVPTVH